ncbi:hypothetical protein PbJCM13498_34110 [Prolixibacter bellariivorans]|uniref:NACHT domain-containing protein n=1 Tax=Prolixibacter bellariivorans TaxID=314319 RepID=A0A5M4B3P6_9BACT|nr:hypothetical protein [Prolixibacter bellariivorans]GET34548.1 hypothetical protein PbJCM13498_34110 [Prolixibacter bellariivorans]
MNDRFLYAYNDEELDQIEDNLDVVYSDFPFSIAYPINQYEIFLEEEDYFYAFSRFFDVFEISVQYTSSLLITLLQKNQVPVDDQLRKIISSIVEKPLSFGDWVSDIFLVLLKKGNEFLPENELIRSLSEAMFNRKGNILTGWPGRKGEEFKSIVYFRNSYFGHDTTLSKNIYRELLEKIEPRMFQFIKALYPISAYTPFTVTEVIDEENDQKAYSVLLLSGSSAHTGRPIRIAADNALQEKLYYVVQKKIRRRDLLNKEDIINISPFVVYLPCNEEKQEEKYSYLFQTIHAKNLRRLKYISSHENAASKETELFKDQFAFVINQLLNSALIGSNYKISVRRHKSLEEMLERGNNATKNFLGEMKRDKYDPNLFTPRKYLDEAFALFLANPANGFVLLGNAGSGKTNQICHWADRLIADKQLVVTLNSKLFSQTTLEGHFQNIFDEGKKDLLTILTDLHEEAEKGGKMVFFLFDAINECLQYGPDGTAGKGAVELLCAIDHFLVRHNFPLFKVVISCRTYTWEEVIHLETGIMKHQHWFTSAGVQHDGAPSHLSVKGFTEDELRETYPKYQQKFRLKTHTEELFTPNYAIIRTRLSDPLVLKMAGSIFRDNYLPQDIRQFHSIALFEDFLRENGLDESRGNEKLSHLLNMITRELWHQRTDGIRFQNLYQAYEDEHNSFYSLSHLLFTDDAFNYSDSFKSLLDKGILRVEKRHSIKELRFVYERYQEYLFSKLFRDEENDKLPQPNLPIPAEAYKRELSTGKNYAVVRNALRTALISDYIDKEYDPHTIIQLACDQQYEVRQLIIDALAVLLSEDYPSVCRLVEQMLQYRRDQIAPSAEKLEDIELKLEESHKHKKEYTPEEINQLKESFNKLTDEMAPIIRIRRVATHTIYEIFKSNIYARGLYDEKHHPFRYLQKAMSDPIAQVRDNVSLYIYYISKFDTQIGLQILEHLSNRILNTNMLSLIKTGNRRELQQSYFEPASRIGMLMVVEALVQKQDYDLSKRIVETWKQILRKYTLNHTLIKLVMPFFKFFLRRQVTVQVAYVNNGLEYQHFWNTIPANSENGEWSRDKFRRFVPYLLSEQSGFDALQEDLVQAVSSGDAFSYFLMERVMIVQGFKDWNLIRSVVLHVVNLPEDHLFVDYIQMSMLYVLFHILEKSETANEEAFELFSGLTERWTVRCIGLFHAHYNEKANKNLPYKQYTLNWYGAAYCSIYGDGETRPGDDRPMPVFYRLIETSFHTRNKELLYYCIENIAVLVSDFGRYKSALPLFGYILELFGHESTIYEFDQIKLEREGYDSDLRSFLCKILGTIKSYYPKEVEFYINNTLVNSSFPNIDKFREELLSYNQSHETIGDLLTHKFGNFVVWALLYDKNISAYFTRVMNIGADVDDYFSWFDGVTRLSFRELFDVKF